MTSSLFKHSFHLPSLDALSRQNFTGSDQANMKLIERTLGVQISFKNDRLHVIAHDKKQAMHVHHIIHQMMARASTPLTHQIVKEIIYQEQSVQTQTNKSNQPNKKLIPKNKHQAAYVDSMQKKAVTFAVGPAGTGKTYLAVHQAIEAFKQGEVHKLVFVRPAVEAGEKLGFLPGDLVEKVLPYLRPIYDALYELFGIQQTQKLIQTDVIEVLPLAFMRGRTLNEAFIILDEAQNTTVMQMKMFLTRMGFSSRMVITGDVTQTDLPRGTQSGLEHAVGLFSDMPDIAIHQFNKTDIVRHPLITKIIDCYEQAGES